MKVRGWERIYRERGDLQYDVLPKVKRTSAAFQRKSYEKILDLGCGTGKHSIFLAKQGFQVYATDMSSTGLKIAKEKSESQRLNIQFKHHDMREIPFTDGFFDAVLCIWTIYHGTLPDIQRTIKEIYRVLKSRGTFITDFLSVTDSTYGTGTEIEKNTFIGEKGEEKDVPHHYVTREELIQLLLEFSHVKIRASSNSYTDDRENKYIRKYYNVEAVK